MAYWGYYDFIVDFIKRREFPTVLEVGVDKGQTFIPLLSFMSKHCEKFELIGVDILRRTELSVQHEQMEKDLSEEQRAIFYQESSLVVLPKFIEHLKENAPEQQGLFDIMLIDGDHNYYTVEKEMECVPDLLKPGGFVVFDDYSNRWGTEDEYFADFKEYENNEFATQREGTEHSDKKGTKPAIDEFLENNPEWIMTDAICPGHEPILIYRSGELNFYDSESGEEVKLEGITEKNKEPEGEN